MDALGHTLQHNSKISKFTSIKIIDKHQEQILQQTQGSSQGPGCTYSPNEISQMEDRFLSHQHFIVDFQSNTEVGEGKWAFNK